MEESGNLGNGITMQCPNEEPEDFGTGEILLNNSFAVAVGVVLGYVAQFSSTLLLAHILGPEGSGFVNYALRVSWIFLVVASFGAPTALSYLIPKSQDKLQKSQLRIAALVLSIPTGALATLALIALSGSLSGNLTELAAPLSIAAITVPFSLVYLIETNSIRGVFRFKAYSAGIVLVPVLVLLTILLLLLVGFLTTTTALLASLFSNIIGMLVFLEVSRSDFSFVRPKTCHIQSIVGIGVGITVMALVLAVMDSVDSILIVILTGNSVLLGQYAIAYSFMVALRGLAEPLAMVTLPLVSFYASKGETQKLSQTMSLGFKLTLLILAPVCVLGAVAASDIIPLLLPSSFTDTASYLSILLLSVPAMGIHSLAAKTLIAREKLALTALILFAGLTLSVCTKPLMLWILGGLGMAISSVLGFLLVGILSVVALRTRLGFRFPGYSRVIALPISMLIVLVPVRVSLILVLPLDSPITRVLVVLALCLFSFMLAAVIRPLKPEESRYAEEIVRRTVGWNAGQRIALSVIRILERKEEE